MNKWEKEVTQSLLDSEESALKELEKQYRSALNEINQRIKMFQVDIDLLDEAMNTEGMTDAAKDVLLSQKRSKIYQKQFQEALQGQISGILDNMQGKNYSTINNYLKESYEDSYIGTLYDLNQQGIPIMTPIDQASVTKAILTDSKVSDGLYNALGVDVSRLKKSISQEISRGIASALPYSEIARNIANVSKAPMHRAMTITRTEGHRIQQTATDNAAQDAKDHGADLVKIWDATLDGLTRESHRMVDGEVRELDEKFSNGLMFPGDPAGSAGEVINCRCARINKPRWAVESGIAKMDNFTGELMVFDSPKDYNDFKEQYWKAIEEKEKQFGVRYGNTDVDLSVINSEEYKAKFANITANENLNNSIYDVSKTVLKHCDGTEHEDMYLFNASNGDVISKITDTARKGGISYTEEFKNALANSRDSDISIIGLHNHPQGTPPSPDDFRKAYENGYSFGIIIGHNGQIYKYETPKGGISKDEAAAMSRDIGIFVDGGIDVDRAFKLVYDSYGLNYSIIAGGEM